MTPTTLRWIVTHAYSLALSHFAPPSRLPPAPARRLLSHKPSSAARPLRCVNRLAGATSPYLLQHAENPVDWYPWGDEAFELARAEEKPLLVSVGYSSGP